MTHVYTTGQEAVIGLSFIGLMALNAWQLHQSQRTSARTEGRVRVIQGTARQQLRLLYAHRTFERELQEELHRQERLVYSLLVYVRLVEFYGVEHREETEDIYLRFDIITESYQNIIDQRNQTIEELREALAAERRTINNLTSALFDLREQLNRLKGE